MSAMVGWKVWDLTRHLSAFAQVLPRTGLVILSWISEVREAEVRTPIMASLKRLPRHCLDATEIWLARCIGWSLLFTTDFQVQCSHQLLQEGAAVATCRALAARSSTVPRTTRCSRFHCSPISMSGCCRMAESSLVVCRLLEQKYARKPCYVHLSHQRMLLCG